MPFTVTYCTPCAYTCTFREFHRGVSVNRDRWGRSPVYAIGGVSPPRGMPGGEGKGGGSRERPSGIGDRGDAGPPGEGGGRSLRSRHWERSRSPPFPERGGSRRRGKRRRRSSRRRGLALGRDAAEDTRVRLGKGARGGGRREKRKESALREVSRHYREVTEAPPERRRWLHRHAGRQEVPSRLARAKGHGAPQASALAGGHAAEGGYDVECQGATAREASPTPRRSARSPLRPLLRFPRRSSRRGDDVPRSARPPQGGTRHGSRPRDPRTGTGTT